MRKSIQQLALVATLLCPTAYAVQDPALSLQLLQAKEQQAIKQLELISSQLASKSVRRQERNRLEQERLNAQKELASIRQSITMSKKASSNDMVSYTNE